MTRRVLIALCAHTCSLTAALGMSMEDIAALIPQRVPNIIDDEE